MISRSLGRLKERIYVSCRRLAAAGLAGFTVVLLCAGTPTTLDAPFMAANTAAMERMMTDMAVSPTGDVDQDFVSMMEPHHQGAVEMAQAELRWGHNELLRRIAQEIIVEQRQEIVAMRLATDRSLPAADPTPDQERPASTTGMAMKQPEPTSTVTR